MICDKHVKTQIADVLQSNAGSLESIYQIGAIIKQLETNGNDALIYLVDRKNVRLWKKLPRYSIFVVEPRIDICSAFITMVNNVQTKSQDVWLRDVFLSERLPEYEIIIRRRFVVKPAP